MRLPTDFCTSVSSHSVLSRDFIACAAAGDTVGDPCKDTAGPSLHVLIKMIATISLVMAPLFLD